MDFESFKTCFAVNKAWREKLMSDSVQKKARDIFSEEIVKDEMQLVSAATDGRTERVIKLLSTNLIDVNCSHNPSGINYNDEDLHAHPWTIADGAKGTARANRDVYTCCNFGTECCEDCGVCCLALILKYRITQLYY